MTPRIALVLILAAPVACGDDDGDDDDDVVTIDAATGAPDAPGETPDAAADTPDAAGGADAAGADAGSEGLEVTFTAVHGLGDCMPIVPPDPLDVSFTAVYDNTGGASAAKVILSEVEITWDDGRGMSATQRINVAPSVVVIAAGDIRTVTHDKTAAIDDLPMDCAYCGGTLKVNLSLTINGADPVVFTSDTGDVACSF